MQPPGTGGTADKNGDGLPISDRSRFHHRIDAILEKFNDMRDDLDRERKVMTKSWAKREEQLGGALDFTTGLYGDLQGIAGRAMHEIESLEVQLIDSNAAGPTSFGASADRLDPSLGLPTRPLRSFCRTFPDSR